MDFKKFAERLNLSAEELAEVAGVTPSCAYTWLSGRNVPKYETIMILLQHGMRLDELFDDSVCQAVGNTHRDDFSPVARLTDEDCRKIVKCGLNYLHASGESLNITLKG